MSTTTRNGITVVVTNKLKGVTLDKWIIESVTGIPRPMDDSYATEQQAIEAGFAMAKGNG
ncbi:hypothetical protein QEM43_004148 [Pseudomonas putida]|uniref:hypothetical protein n=1 Tax=Pseudomonas putida TaxID=303 RepID=UPI002168AC86|nr:hypothetical protein [Pseudomonas putida]EKT4568432.1 hypothetical protein [Pseudomonas putida]MCS4064220.1 hypothetical protein [Pseudomonas putida]